MKLPISKIAVLNRQRKDLDPKKVAELAASIKEHGLFHPITVRRPFEAEVGVTVVEPYVLCLGGRRLAAHLLLGLSEIEAQVKDDMDMLSAAIVELEENLQRENLSWQEEVDAKAAIHELRSKQNAARALEEGRRTGQTVAETAAELGEDTATLSRDLKLSRMMKEDPSLRTATSKVSAMRLAEHKAHVAERVKKIGAVELDALAKRIVCADASQFIRTIPDASVDMVFTDLPYMIDYFENAASGANMKSQYDDSVEGCKDFIADIVPHMIRVVKPSGWIVLFMCYEWHTWLQERLQLALASNGNTVQWPSPEMPPWIWTRRGAGSFGHRPDLHAANRFEMIVALRGPDARLMKKPVENVLDFAPLPSAQREHAMQKPPALCEELITRCTLAGELVADFCFGSGQHLASAAKLGRNFLGCDKNPENLPKALALVSENISKSPLVKL